MKKSLILVIMAISILTNTSSADSEGSGPVSLEMLGLISINPRAIVPPLLALDLIGVIAGQAVNLIPFKSDYIAFTRNMAYNLLSAERGGHENDFLMVCDKSNGDDTLVINEKENPFSLTYIFENNHVKGYRSHSRSEGIFKTWSEDMNNYPELKAAEVDSLSKLLDRLHSDLCASTPHQKQRIVTIRPPEVQALSVVDLEKAKSDPKMTFEDAVNSCSAQGKHLPTARELIRFFIFIQGVNEGSEITPNSLNQILTKNADGKLDDFFYYSHAAAESGGYSGPADKFFWTSSRSLIDPDEANVFGLDTWRSYTLPIKNGEFVEERFVLCFPNSPQ